MRSKIKNEHFRAAAARLYPSVSVGEWGGVDKLAEGGAFVEVQVFVPESEAASEEAKAAEDAAPRAEKPS